MSERVVRLEFPAPDVGQVVTGEQGSLEREVLNRDILNAVPVAIYVTDAQGRITFYNEAAVALAGRRPVLGIDEWCVTWKLYWPDGTPLPHDQCPMALALKQGDEVRGIEAVAERPDGSRITFMPYPTLLKSRTGEILGAVNVLVDITERKADEDRQRLLTNEVNHRANNLLAVVQAMVRLTDGDCVEGFRTALSGRVEALSRAHNLLAKSRWMGADLQHLVSQEMAPYVADQDSRVWVSGTILPMGPQAAQSMAMVVHELATNAVKHGALSGPDGNVMIQWRVGPQDVSFRWREANGPPCAEPSRAGVGSTVITRATAQLGAEVAYTWAASGLVVDMTIPNGAIST
jgi:PAS domain S-box-containing protein